MSGGIFPDSGRRIVLASEFWFGSTGFGMAHGFRLAGWDVAAVDTRDHFLRSCSLGVKALSRLSHSMCVASYNAAVLDAVETIRPTAFVTVKGMYLSASTIDAIRRGGVMTINYYPDVHFDHAGMDHGTLDLYDRFVTTKSFQLPILEQRLGAGRVVFLPHGYSSLVHRPSREPVQEQEFVADCGHVGNYSSTKAHWLEAVARRMPKVELCIVGSGWKENTKGTVLERCALGHQLSGDFYAWFVERVRVNLAFHSGPSVEGEWQDNVSTRTFEIPACKGFMLHVDNEEVRSLFEPGMEIDVFADEAQLCERVDHYLARPDLRRVMIERAFARCVPAYSYDSRARAIVELIENGMQCANGMTSRRKIEA